MTFIKLGGVVPPLSRPKVDQKDMILSGGSLALYEWGHNLVPFAGLPANNGLVPNIAVNEAKALIPTGTDATLSAIVKAGANDPTKVKVERTGKGGLHVIVPKAAPISGGAAYLGLFGRTAIAQYIKDNINHEFFFSYWGVETRTAKTGPGAFSGLSFSASPNATNLHYVMSHDGSVYPNTANKTGSSKEINGATAPAGPLADVNGSDGTGTATAYSALPLPNKLRITAGIKGTGSTLEKDGAAVESYNFFKLFSEGIGNELFPHPSQWPSSGIHYRSYIEDLTVSGRSFATVDALDKSEYSKHVLTAGGRYYNDTYTAPASFIA
jgi:hypothetical protein